MLILLIMPYQSQNSKHRVTDLFSYFAYNNIKKK